MKYVCTKHFNSKSQYRMNDRMNDRFITSISPTNLTTYRLIWLLLLLLLLLCFLSKSSPILHLPLFKATCTCTYREADGCIYNLLTSSPPHLVSSSPPFLLTISPSHHLTISSSCRLSLPDHSSIYYLPRYGTGTV